MSLVKEFLLVSVSSLPLFLENRKRMSVIHQSYHESIYAGLPPAVYSYWPPLSLPLYLCWTKFDFFLLKIGVDFFCKCFHYRKHFRRIVDGFSKRGSSTWYHAPSFTLHGPVKRRAQTKHQIKSLLCIKRILTVDIVKINCYMSLHYHSVLRSSLIATFSGFCILSKFFCFNLFLSHFISISVYDLFKMSQL